jgi:hypothetical protein
VMARLFSLVLVTAAFSTALVAQEAEPTDPKATDWPQFRGPKRDNISPDKKLLKE